MPRVFNVTKGQISVSGVKGLPPLVLQAGACHTFRSYEEYHKYMKRLVLFKDQIRIDLTPDGSNAAPPAPETPKAETVPPTEADAPARRKPGPKPKQEAEAKVEQPEQQSENKTESTEPQLDPPAV